MSAGNSPERIRMLRGLGAEVELVPRVEGTPGRGTGRNLQAAGARAAELAKERGAYFVDQFNNPAGVLVHEEGTGPEMLFECREIGP